MRRSVALVLSLATLMIGHAADAQEEERFDAQVFRPSGAPRDLVMVQKSEVIGHMSPTVGLYSDLGFDPLVFVGANTGERVEAVAGRLQLTGMAGVGFYDWIDFNLAVPFVAWQTGDNLRMVGSEGPVQTSSVGDVRLSARVTIPYFNRKDDATQGFGMAVVGNLNLPTGSTRAFTGDGVLTGGASVIADYRLGVGALITANAGVWLRPDRQLAGVRLGNMASVGVAGEAYLVQSWGLSVLGGLWSYPSLTKFPDDPRQLPAEILIALRWQTQQGFTFTFGGSFGAACGFGAPALRIFNGITITPKTSREQEQINRILKQERDDPDEDGLFGDVDKCPFKPGPPENNGCPDEDADDDGFADREDDCPNLPGKRKGCPPAYVKGDEIVIMDKVYFATDDDVILDESKPILDAVAEVLLLTPEILEIRVEGHTDIRAGDAYNLALSHRRSKSVHDYLIERGVAPERLEFQGFGHSQPLLDDSHCDRPDEQLDSDCLFITAKNRRVVFKIVRTSIKKDAVPEGEAAPSLPFN